MENTLNLTKKLISIPSFVDGKTSEEEISSFLLNYCSANPSWKVTKQAISEGRSNLFITDGYPTKLLFLGHMDTVQPKKMNQTKPLINRDRLFGLGSADMKGNIAAFMNAWKASGKTEGISALLYCDEEYDFLGMKGFIKQIQPPFNPELILSGDGTDLTLGNACRGIIELSAQVRGKSGHASNPLSGVNAVTRSYAALRRLQKYFQKFCKDPYLGKTTINLAYLRGGLYLGQDDQTVLLGKQGNNIPDFAEFVIDIRPSVKTINAKRVRDLLEGFLIDEGLEPMSFQIRHDLGVWNTERSQLTDLEQIISNKIVLNRTDPGRRGFIDIQLLAEAFPNIPCCTFGAGDGSTIHSENENIPLQQLRNVESIYKDVISWKGGEKSWKKD